MDKLNRILVTYSRQHDRISALADNPLLDTLRQGLTLQRRFTMATKPAQDNTFTPDLYLSPDQQELLLTALSSNSSGGRGVYQTYPVPATNTTKPNTLRSNSDRSTQLNGAGVINHEIYESPSEQGPGSGTLGSLGFEDSPFLDYDLDDGNFEWDNSGDQLIGNLPGLPGYEEDGDLHEKRKGHGEDHDDEDGGGGKRREGEERTTKKPGRKPITSEPTSVSFSSIHRPSNLTLTTV